MNQESGGLVLSPMSGTLCCLIASFLMPPGLNFTAYEIKGGSALHDLCLRPEHVLILYEEGGYKTR